MSVPKIVEEGRIIIHPIRYAILNYLVTNDGAYLSQITRNIGNPIDRRLVSFHLLSLEKAAFVEGKYEISTEKKSKGRAIKRYFLTKKVHEVLTELCIAVEKTRDEAKKLLG